LPEEDLQLYYTFKAVLERKRKSSKILDKYVRFFLSKMLSVMETFLHLPFLMQTQITKFLHVLFACLVVAGSESSFLCKEKLMRETRERYHAPAKKMSSSQESVFYAVTCVSSVGNAQISFPQFFNKKRRGGLFRKYTRFLSAIRDL
jgi:hypothetical protein